MSSIIIENKMNQTKMLEELRKQEEILKEDLIGLEQQFTFKKEEYLKILGAIEALSMLEESNTQKGEE